MKFFPQLSLTVCLDLDSISIVPILQSFGKERKKPLYLSDVKVFVLLFSVYLLLLACVPCGDLSAENSVELGSTSSSHANQHRHGGSDEDDSSTHEACTPFCFCACCGISIAEAQIAQPLVFTKVGEVSRSICHFEPNRLEGVTPLPPTHPPIV